MKGALVPMPSFHAGKGNASVVSQHAGRVIVNVTPLRAMTCSPMLFVYV